MRNPQPTIVSWGFLNKNSLEAVRGQSLDRHFLRHFAAKLRNYPQFRRISKEKIAEYQIYGSNIPYMWYCSIREIAVPLHHVTFCYFSLVIYLWLLIMNLRENERESNEKSPAYNCKLGIFE